MQHSLHFFIAHGPQGQQGGAEKTGRRNDEKPANKNQVFFIVRRNYRSSKFGRT